MMQGDSKDTHQGKRLGWLPWAGGCVALFLIAFYAATFHGLPWDKDPSAWGQFGDYVGGLLNPTISLFTLIVAVYVWNLQKEELKETREALKAQGKIADRQRSEQRFFDLLNLYHTTVSTIVFGKQKASFDLVEPVSAAGKRAFSLLTSASSENPLNEIAAIFSNQTNMYGPPFWEKHQNEQLVRTVWGENSPILDHYFRVVFALLRDADFLFQEEDTRRRYIKILRAQLSRDEVSLIAMNLLYDDEGEKMRPLVEEYGLLKHLPASHLRTFAEKKLAPRSFGRKWAESHLLKPLEL